MKALMRLAMSPNLWSALLVIGGLACGLFGLYLLAGPACSLIVGGALSVAIGFLIMIGMVRAG